MRRILPRVLVLLFLAVLSLPLFSLLVAHRAHVDAPTPGAAAVTAAPAPDPQLAEASNEVLRLRAALGNFLLAVKDPYRPPLGDNRDIAAALAGRNRLGLIFVPTNDPALRDGQLVDRWGTPYWFHPRAPDAIDVASAGPDRTLFTADDLAAGAAR